MYLHSVNKLMYLFPLKNFVRVKFGQLLIGAKASIFLPVYCLCGHHKSMAPYREVCLLGFFLDLHWYDQRTADKTDIILILRYL